MTFERFCIQSLSVEVCKQPTNGLEELSRHASLRQMTFKFDSTASIASKLDIT